MKRFKGTDFADIDTLLSEEEIMIRGTIREWVEDNVIPEIDSHYQHDHFFQPWQGEIAELGVLGATLDGWGGAGLDAVAAGLIYQELERGDSGLRSFASVMNSLVIHPIATYGSDEQKERWLPDLVAGRKVGCFGLTEPDYGSNPGGMLTKAEKTSAGWLLSGAKRWITNGTIADVAIVFAKTADGVRGFLVERGTPGFTAPEIHRKWSLRASVTSELLFEDCELPADSLLPGSDIGLKTALMCLNQARYGIAWGAIGVMMDCYEEAKEYVMTRTQFRGRPLASHQLVQKHLSTMLTEITKSQFLMLQIGRLKEQGRANHAHISMAKRNNCYWALRIARTARDMLGASGITHEYRAGRHAMNMESVKTYEGAHDVHHLILGEYITGIPAYDPPAVD